MKFGVDERSAATGLDCNSESDSDCNCPRTRAERAFPAPRIVLLGRVSLSHQIAQLLVSNGAHHQRDPERTSRNIR